MASVTALFLFSALRNQNQQAVTATMTRAVRITIAATSPPTMVPEESAITAEGTVHDIYTHGCIGVSIDYILGHWRI